jgi:hypothetical protein
MALRAGRVKKKMIEGQIRFKSAERFLREVEPAGSLQAFYGTLHGFDSSRLKSSSSALQVSPWPTFL